MSDKNHNITDRRRALRLPFMETKVDMGEWAYDHRVGLCVTIIAYLVISIAFVFGKIIVTTQSHTQGIYIDVEQLMELEQLRDELEQQAQQREEQQEQQEQMNWDEVKNSRSNEVSEVSENEHRSSLSELQDQARRVQEQMDQNRSTFDEGLGEAEALGKRKESTGSDDKRLDSKVEGNVTVSYNLNNPVRYAQRLVIPAYRCKGGGEVVVEIEVDRAGTVVATRVVRGGDDCMRESATTSASRSTFDDNPSAPQRQRGTIHYIFIPQ